MVSIVLETVSNFILEVINAGGYFGVFFLMALESVNIPIPSEIIMPFSGFLAAGGAFSFWLVVIVGTFGNLVGSVFSYWLGYLVRLGFLKRKEQNVSREIERAKKWVERFGDWAVFLSRLLPIVRTFISFPLGVLKVKSFWRFSFLTFSGSFIWSTFLTYLGFIFGKNWQVLEIYFRKFDYLILLAILAAIGWWLWKHLRNKPK